MKTMHQPAGVIPLDSVTVMMCRPVVPAAAEPPTIPFERYAGRSRDGRPNATK
jgi:hypothetical protein